MKSNIEIKKGKKDWKQFRLFCIVASYVDIAKNYLR